MKKCNSQNNQLKEDILKYMLKKVRSGTNKKSLGEEEKKEETVENVLYIFL